jgi:hypothetical protein
MGILPLRHASSSRIHFHTLPNVTSSVLLFLNPAPDLTPELDFYMVCRFVFRERA